MSHIPGFAPCPTATPPSANPPTGTVVVSILSVRPNTDLEGDDDFVPFYDNRADIYGFVTIDGEEFNLPKIEENDFPHWDQDGVFRKAISGTVANIKIEIRESDSGLTGDDDQVDICPASGKAHLDLVFDLCSLEISGDVIAPSQGVVTASGGSGDGAATIQFKVELEDGRPVTQDDLALVEIDLVQVRHHTGRLVAQKPTVVMVRVANNYSTDITTSLRLQIDGASFSLDESLPLTVRAGEVKKTYFFQDAPLLFPESIAPYNLAVVAILQDPDSSTRPSDDCRNTNDFIKTGDLWQVITTFPKFLFLWMKVGLLLDIGNYTPDSQFAEIRELGHAYIKAVFPVANPVAVDSLIPLSPPTTAALDYLVTVLAAFQIPADALEPFALVFELNAVAILTGCDRLMGVLPRHDWFKRFSFWGDITGLSLGQFAPHAVIFLPQTKSDDGLDSGPPITLPGHELGHTYGLSTDSRLKQSWVCAVDWPVVGSLPCGAFGGLDEYKHEDVSLQDGNPASGYWVARGDEPTALQSLVNQEQCDSHCLMGTSPRNAHLDWGSDGRWIDAADYEQLLDKLSGVSDPEVVFVSGMISWNDQMHMGPIYHLPQGTPDRDDSFGLYAARFVDEKGKSLGEFGIPIHWNIPEFSRPMPVTFFGLKLPYPERTRQIVFLNRGTNKILATQPVSLHVPTVQIKSPEPEDRVTAGSLLEVEWTARDDDKDPLTFAVMLSHDREVWWPAVIGLSEQHFELATDVLQPGIYYLKIQAHDGVHLGESQHLPIRIVSY